MHRINLSIIAAAVLALSVGCASRSVTQSIGAESTFLHQEILAAADQVASVLGNDHPLHVRLLQLANTAYLHDEKCRMIESEWNRINQQLGDFMLSSNNGGSQ